MCSASPLARPSGTTLCSRGFMTRRNVKRLHSPHDFLTVQRNACDSPATVASRQPDCCGGNVTSTQFAAWAGSAGSDAPGFRYCKVPFFWKSNEPNFTGFLSTTRYWICSAFSGVLAGSAAHGPPAATPSVARMAFLKSPSVSLPLTHALQASRSMSFALSAIANSGPPVVGGAARAADTVPTIANTAGTRRFAIIIVETPSRQGDRRPVRQTGRGAVVRA